MSVISITPSTPGKGGASDRVEPDDASLAREMRKQRLALVYLNAVVLQTESIIAEVVVQPDFDKHALVANTDGIFGEAVAQQVPLDVLQDLLDRGCQWRPGRARSPLMAALRCDHEQAFLFMVNHPKADFGQLIPENPHGFWGYLLEAETLGWDVKACLQALEDKGVRMSAEELMEQFKRALWRTDVGLMKLLVAYGADPHDLGNGTNAAHALGYLSVDWLNDVEPAVNLLRLWKVDLNALDKFGKRPLEVHRTSDYGVTVKTLLAALRAAGARKRGFLRRWISSLRAA